jgi:hypothetical protein
MDQDDGGYFQFLLQAERDRAKAEPKPAIPEQISAMAERFSAALKNEVPDTQPWRAEFAKQSAESAIEAMPALHREASSLAFKSYEGGDDIVVLVSSKAQLHLANTLFGLQQTLSPNQAVSTLERRCVQAFLAGAFPELELLSDAGTAFEPSHFATFHFSPASTDEECHVCVLLNRRRPAGQNSGVDSSPFAHEAATRSPLLPILEGADLNVEYVVLGAQTTLRDVANLGAGQELRLGSTGDLQCAVRVAGSEMSRSAIAWRIDAQATRKADIGVDLYQGAKNEALND